MLSPSEYIVNELERMRDRFFGFKVVYAFDEILNAHIIQISHRADFVKNKMLLNWKVEFIERFESVYSDEEMILTAPFSFHHMDKVLFNYFPSVQGSEVVSIPVEEYYNQESGHSILSSGFFVSAIYKNIEKVFNCNTGVSSSSMCKFEGNENFALC